MKIIIKIPLRRGIITCTENCVKWKRARASPLTQNQHEYNHYNIIIIIIVVPLIKVFPRRKTSPELFTQL